MQAVANNETKKIWPRNERHLKNFGGSVDDRREPEDGDLRPLVICFCGSTKFKEEFIAFNAELTMKGAIVLSVGFFAHSEKREITRLEKARLDVLHLRKIDLCDAILVINVDGYVGESTEREIEYARAKGKGIIWAYLDPTSVEANFMKQTQSAPVPA